MDFRAKPRLENLTKVFVLGSASSSGSELYEVPKDLVPDRPRQRRAHKKSKAACNNCKKRRVKVDLSISSRSDLRLLMWQIFPAV